MPLSQDKLTDQQWVRQRIKWFAKERQRYCEYAEMLRVVLGQAANRYTPLAIVQARAKTIASYAEKIQRKIKRYRQTDSEGNPVHPVTDLCGGRVITQTLSQVRAISKFIEDHFEIDEINSIDVATRLRSNEFGYLSVHYIVRFKPDIFPTKEIPVRIPKSIYGLYAEIQVRTLLEHAWADVEHNLLYKSNIKVPKKWEREFARLAAILEDTDEAFCRLEAGFEAYGSNYGAYMTEEEMRNEIGRLSIVLEADTENTDVAHRIARLAMCLGNWKMAVGTLKPFKNSDNEPILRDLGIALCKLYKKGSRNFSQGQKYIEQAIRLNPADSDALSALGGTWKKIDEKKAMTQYQRAYEVKPDDPYPLGNYLEYEINKSRNLVPVSLVKPCLNAAIQKCWNQIDVGANIPWAFYDMGKFHLLLNKPYESLNAYAKAVQLTTSAFMIEVALNSLDKLAVVRQSLIGYEWIYKFLLLALATRFGKDANKLRLRKFKKMVAGKIHKPVVIVAGGCEPTKQAKLRSYRKLIGDAFKRFKGTIISGGTVSGISGFIGDVAEGNPDSIQAVSYVPRELPKGTSLDRHYSKVIHTDGTDFSPLESLQSWIDIIVSGIAPANIKVIGIDGGVITATEYRIALALGAKVAVIEESGGEAAKIVLDNQWNTCKNLLPLPADSATIGTFVGSGISKLPPEIRDTIAMAIHQQYRQDQMKTLLAGKPSTVEWKNLGENLKESNRQQADHIFEKLSSIGLSVYKVEGREIELWKLSDREVEILAKMEHARWNVERILDGWKLGPEKELEKKISSYLVPWEKLSEEVKEWDRQTVRKIPEYLAKIDLEIRRT